MTTPSSSVEQTITLQSVNEANNQADDRLLFPDRVFPEILRRAVEDIITGTGLNPCYTYAATLSTFATAIGATHKVNVKGKGWEEPVNHFLFGVGDPGTNKTASFAIPFRPIEQKDKQEFELYKCLLKDYEKCKTAKPQTAEGEFEPTRPVLKQHTVKDVTPEAVCEILSNNKRGITINTDEGMGLIKGISAYQKKTSDEWLLSAFSGRSISKSRKGGEPLFISDPVLNICTTIQPGVLKDLFGDGRVENGFADRCLFVFPDDNTLPEFSFERQAKKESFETYEALINKVLSLEFKDDLLSTPYVLNLTDEAKRLYQEWVNQQRAIRNNEKSTSRIKGIYAKLEMYTFRFSLILQLIEWACGVGDRHEIGEAAMQSAIRLTEYFKRTAVKVLEFSYTHQGKTDKKSEFFNSLPETFKKKDALEVAELIGVSTRSCEYWLDEPQLFTKVKHGCYKKNIAA